MGLPTPLIRATRIAGRVRQLGRAIAHEHAGQAPVLLVLLDGAAVFAADLMRAIPLPGVRVHYLRAASYGAARHSSGSVGLEPLPSGLAGESVVIVDDILDSGRTLAAVSAAVEAAGAARVRICVLLDKPTGREVPVRADWIGFTIGPGFIVGYGLDDAGRFRHLPDICLAGAPPSH
jgi:hypoxanthine phosphoribosyltransferase